MNKEYIINDSVTTLAIAIADHQQTPNESYVSTCLDKVSNVFKPQWIKNQVTGICIIHYLINYKNTYIDCIEYEKIKNCNQRFIQ